MVERGRSSKSFRVCSYKLRIGLGVARVLEPGTSEDRLARELLGARYEPVEHDSREEWGRTALPVVIEFN